MKKKTSGRTAGLIALIVALPAIAYAGWKAVSPGDGSSHTPRTHAVVYRSPTCGCCANFVTYLKRHGFDVETKFFSTDERPDMGVPDDLASCHTTQIGDYTIEGHIPVETIDKLLAEQPALKGIGMPGMPSGSPGMPGAKTAAFVISGFSEAGDISPYDEQ